MGKEIVVDCLGEVCPVPVIRARLALKRASLGDVILVETDHSCAMKSVPEVLCSLGYNPEVYEVAPGVWRIRVLVSKDPLTKTTSC